MIIFPSLSINVSRFFENSNSNLASEKSAFDLGLRLYEHTAIYTKFEIPSKDDTASIYVDSFQYDNSKLLLEYNNFFFVLFLLSFSINY